MDRDNSLDIARALSMLYIVGVWHLNNYTQAFDLAPWGEYVKNASLGLFMFLSGYLLGGRYVVRDTKSLWNFMKKRVLRIMPLFALSLYLYYNIGKITISTALLSMVGLSTFIPPMPLSLWFVSMIIVFYILFPLLSGRGILSQIVIAIIITAVAFAMVMLGSGIEKRFIYYFPCFAVGVILARYKMDKLLTKELISTSILAFVCASMICWHFKLEWTDWRVIMFRPIIAFAGAILILWISQTLAHSARIVKWSGVIAYASMAAYMFHRHIFQFIRDHVWCPVDGAPRVLWLVCVCLPVIMIIGYWLQWLYDKGLKKIIREK